MTNKHFLLRGLMTIRKGCDAVMFYVVLPSSSLLLISRGGSYLMAPPETNHVCPVVSWLNSEMFSIAMLVVGTGIAVKWFIIAREKALRRKGR